MNPAGLGRLLGFGVGCGIVALMDKYLYGGGGFGQLAGFVEGIGGYGRFEIVLIFGILGES